MSSLSNFSESSGSVSSSESTKSVGVGGSTLASEVLLVKEDQPNTAEDLAVEIVEVDLPHRRGMIE